MLMLLSPEGELAIACWMCRQSFQDRHALRRHETSAHLSHCAKCGSRHSGKCAAEPLSVSGPRPSPEHTLDREDLITEDVSIEIYHAPGERPALRS